MGWLELLLPLVVLAPEDEPLVLPPQAAVSTNGAMVAATATRYRVDRLMCAVPSGRWMQRGANEMGAGGLMRQGSRCGARTRLVPK